MGNYRKGVEMRQKIVVASLKVFNKYGLQLTLNQLAKYLKLSKGRITNYFPTKDLLFVAMSQEYEIQYASLLARSKPEGELTLGWLIKAFEATMDLQYEHRSTIIFAAVTHTSQKDLHNQITFSYQNNIKGVRGTIEALIHSGIIEPILLEATLYEVFCFQLVNLFTTWVISLSMYHSDKTYKQMKPVYLEGIVRCFYPYFTKKGLAQFQEVGYSAITKLPKN